MELGVIQYLRMELPWMLTFWNANPPNNEIQWQNISTAEFLVTLNIMLSAIERYIFCIKKKVVITNKEYKEKSCFPKYRKNIFLYSFFLICGCLFGFFF